MNKSIGIIGGGISGLTLGYSLKKTGAEVRVYEKEGVPGGVMRTYRSGGWMAESGPNTISARSPEVKDLIRDIGLVTERMNAAPAAKNRYIVRDGELLPLPMGILDFIRTELFNPTAKLRVLGEPFISKSETEEEESVAEFVRRRLGSEILDYAVNPFVGGIYAGEPESLSVKHAFPKLFQLEQQYGSLIKGQIKRRRTRQKRKSTRGETTMFSFKRGIGQLPEQLANNLKDEIKLQARVIKITKTDDQWKIHYSTGTGMDTFRHDAIISTAPVHSLPGMHLPDLDSELIDQLSGIYYPPIRTLTFGFNRKQVKHPLDGFGMLIPEKEPYPMLGTLFSSSLFPNRAPDDHVNLTTFIGGARNPERAQLSEKILKRQILAALDDLLDISGSPVFAKSFYWPRSIPQYNVGYDRFKTTIQNIEENNPGLFFSGNYIAGASVNECIEHALNLSRKVEQYLEKS